MAKSKPQAKQPPEVKFGPYAGGISIAVWLNTIDTASGTRQTRSVTIAPRRYRDQQTGEWKDSYSYRPNDLPVIMHGLEQAWKFILDTPLPNEEDNG